MRSRQKCWQSRQAASTNSRESSLRKGSPCCCLSWSPTESNWSQAERLLDWVMVTSLVWKTGGRNQPPTYHAGEVVIDSTHRSYSQPHQGLRVIRVPFGSGNGSVRNG